MKSVFRSVVVMGSAVVVVACVAGNPPRSEVDPELPAVVPTTDDRKPDNEKTRPAASPRPEPVAAEPKPVVVDTEAVESTAGSVPAIEEPDEPARVTEPSAATAADTGTSEAPMAEGRALSGRVSLTADSRIEFSENEVAEAVAYFVPEGDFRAPTPKNDYIIQTRHKRFVPSVLPIEQGSTVAFPNADPILHNAFSVSPAGRFDVGLYGQGESKEVTFDQPGLVFVHCNVHHAMRAEILVMNTPWFTRVDEDGTFRLDGLPAQPGTLFVWHPRSRPESVPVAAGDGNLMQTVEMQVSSPRVPKHTNKFGKPYRPTRPGN